MKAGDDAEGLFRRILRSGRLLGFPRHPRRLDIVLAVAAGGLVRRHPYTEEEVDEVLIDWLASVRSRIDHVTLRRRMVDCGFLKRTRDGSRYLLNYGRVAGVLGDPAPRIDAGEILASVLAERASRKLAHSRGGMHTAR